jgi:hypothetical protein
MSITTLERPRHRVTGDIQAVLTDLRWAHLEFAGAAADLAPTPTAAWSDLDRIIAAASTEAYDLAAVLTGHPATAPARNVPPVVRLRELAVAQRSLSRALDHHGRVDAPTEDERAAAIRSARQVRRLGSLLQRQIRDSGA